MPSDRTAQNAPEQEMPTASGAVRPLRPDEVKQTLAVRLVPTIDKIRQLSTKFGLRPYRVFLVHVQWTGERIGLGTPIEISRREVQPTPRIRDMSSTIEMLSAFGRLEEGAITVDKISPLWSEDDLLGATPDLIETSLPRAGKHNCEFFWEVQENRPVSPPPVPRRYAPASTPTLSRGGMSWRMVLTKQSVNRTRNQQFKRSEA